MKWYWWVLTIILGLNGLVVLLVALFMILDRMRSRREEKRAREETGLKESEAER
jgi:uncharacterized membrane protein